MGADVMPFAVNRLSEAVRDKVSRVVLLAPGRRPLQPAGERCRFRLGACHPGVCMV
jgi:hypothetical protein